MNKLVTFRGVRHTLAALADMSGVSLDNLRHRLAAGWSIEQAVCIPTVDQRRRGAVVNLVPPFVGPGVASDFGRLEGTGAGNSLRETSEITFSEKAEIS